ncbi:MAG: response regulator transcription factor, partial [Gammaproteobacteria bacterium]
MEPLHLLLADDHTLVRAGLRALLDGMDNVATVIEAENGEQAVALALDHAPDIALLDITMPGLNGLQAAERIRAKVPHTRVIILSMHAAEEYVNRALAIGVSGYLLKDAATLELQAALDAVAAGQTYLSPRITSQLLDARTRPGEPVPKAALTTRQLEVLGLLALG